MNKKISMGLGSLITISAPVATLVSCGGKEEKFNISAEEMKKVAIATDGGSVTDKSFNQQGKEALDLIHEDLEMTTENSKDVFIPTSHDAASINEKYIAALNGGKKIIVTPGFYHVDAIKKFNKETGKELGFILADGVVDSNNVASITYNTKQPGFLAGVLSGLYLKAINDKNPLVATTGGGNFPGVTDFMTGFVEGIKYYNENMVKNSDDKKVEFLGPGTDKAYTDTGFEASGGKDLYSSLVRKGVDILLPVSGPQIGNAITAAKERKDGQQTKVIGVDADQKISHSSDKAYILTSILKDLKVSMHGVYQKISGNSEAPNWAKGFGKITKADISNDLTGIEKTSTGNAGNSSTTWESLYGEIEKPEIKEAAKTNTENVDWDQALKHLKEMMKK